MIDSLKTALGRVFFPDSESGREGRIARHWKKAIDCHQRGKYLESELEFGRAVSIAEEYGEDSLQLARHLDRLADFYHSVGKYADAEELFGRVLAIRESTQGPTDPDLAPALNNLALLNYTQGKYDEGEVLYRRLLPLLEEHLGGEHREVAICLENYAALLRKLKREEEARELSSRASAIRRTLRG